jgi:hypothetical protein
MRVINVVLSSVEHESLYDTTEERRKVLNPEYIFLLHKTPHCFRLAFLATQCGEMINLNRESLTDNKVSK